MNKKRRSFRVIGKTAFAVLRMIKNKKWDLTEHIIDSCSCRSQLMMKRTIYNKKWQKIVS